LRQLIGLVALLIASGAILRFLIGMVLMEKNQNTPEHTHTNGSALTCRWVSSHEIGLFICHFLLVFWAMNWVEYIITYLLIVLQGFVGLPLLLLLINVRHRCVLLLRSNCDTYDGCLSKFFQCVPTGGAVAQPL